MTSNCTVQWWHKQNQSYRPRGFFSLDWLPFAKWANISVCWRRYFNRPFPLLFCQEYKDQRTMTESIHIGIKWIRENSLYGPTTVASSFRGPFFFQKLPIRHLNFISSLIWPYRQLWSLTVLRATLKDHFTPVRTCITKLILVHVSEHFERELPTHVALDYFHITPS